MHKTFNLLLAFCLMTMSTNAQKKSINNISYKDWERIGSYDVNVQGEYVYYTTSSKPGPLQLHLKKLNGVSDDFVSESTGIVKFSPAGGELLFSTRKGTNVLTLGSKTPFLLGNVQNADFDSSGENIVFQKSDTLFIYNIHKKTTQAYSGVIHATFNDSKSAVVLQFSNRLEWMDLLNCHRNVLIVTKILSRVFFDKMGKQIAILEPIENRLTNIYYFSSPLAKPRLILNHVNNFSTATGLFDIHEVFFSDMGTRLNFLSSLKQRTQSKSISKIIKVALNMWSYKDSTLRSEQETELAKDSPERKVLTSIAVSDGKLTFIEQDSLFVVDDWQSADNFFLLRTAVRQEDNYWKKRKIRYFIYHPGTGIKKEIYQTYFNGGISKSPSSRFITWIEDSKMGLITYDVKNDAFIHLTQYIGANKFPRLVTRPTSNVVATAIWSNPVWSKDESSVYLYNGNSFAYTDIWRVDLGDIRKISCITKGYGFKDKLQFGFVFKDWRQEIENDRDDLMLTSLNTSTKEHTFWKLTKEGILNKMSSDSAWYYHSRSFAGVINPPIIKAKKKNLYLVVKQRSDFAPNLFQTSDFKNFRQISNIKPQEKFNWLHTELVRWRSKIGDTSSGILYKPENFSDKIKYPVIFHYYEHRSVLLNTFPYPELSNGQINIPWYVSNGYLVFVPDIEHHTGMASSDIVKTLGDAASELKKYSWVDSTKLGLQGHSFGGYETNCIITHSNLFAAAQSSSGISDLTSQYTGLMGNGNSLAFMAEIGQMNIAAAPWEKPEKFIDNSPIYFTDKVETPLFLMHNQKDGVVPFQQSLGFYLALRRSGKKVWLVDYDGEDHTIESEVARLDFNVRQQQFFDYYLRGKPAPLWMIEGISFKDKDVKTGLELDTLGRKP